MTSSSFAQKQLEKHGWKKGAGLGKTEDGMSDPIKVSLKMDKAGVGHDPGKEFTDHWWLRVFNDAAKKIGTNNQEKKDGSKKESEKKMDRKQAFYAGFVKSSTLTNGVEEKVERSDSSSDEDSEAHQESVPTLNDIHKFCGGATGHKAARFGIKMGGKLARVAKHDQMVQERLQKTAGKNLDSAKEGDGRPVTGSESDSDQVASGGAVSSTVNGGLSAEHEAGPSNEKLKKKKKRKKTKEEKSDSVIDIPVECEIREVNESDIVPERKNKNKSNTSAFVESEKIEVSECDSSQRRKKKSKSKCADTIPVESENTEVSPESDSQRRKKKKSKRKCEEDSAETVSVAVISEFAEEGSGQKRKKKKKERIVDAEELQSAAETASVCEERKKKRKHKEVIEVPEKKKKKKSEDTS